MRHQAKVALSLGESVVLDASWSDANQRQLARVLAQSLHADLVEIRCDLPEKVAIERLRARLAAGDFEALLLDAASHSPVGVTHLVDLKQIRQGGLGDLGGGVDGVQ